MTEALGVLEHPAACRGPGPVWAEMRRILVVRPDNVGDVIMTGPALRALAAAAPAARIDLLASPAGAATAALLPWIADSVVASVSWQQLPGDAPDGATDPEADLVSRLAPREYDAAVVLTSFSQSPWPAAEVCRRAGIPVRVGTSKEFGGAALTHWVPAPPDDGHQVDRALHVLARVGAPADDASLAVSVSPEARARVGRLLESHRGERHDPGHESPDGAVTDTRPLAVLAPGASCPSRRYPAERFAAVGKALADAGMHVVVTGTVREADLVAAVATGVPGATVLAGDLDLPGLAALMERAAVVVANNSGGTHLADAVGTPVAVLFAGTETPRQYEPRSVPAAVLSRPTTCSPCRQLVCPFHQECLDVDPADAAAATLRLARTTRTDRTAGA